MNYNMEKYGPKTVRRNYSKTNSKIEMDQLVKIQTDSFKWFIEKGLKELFEDISPIVSSNDGTLKLHFGDYFFDEPKFNIVECKLRDENYTKALKVKVTLEKLKTGELIEKTLYMGDIPFMTPSGTFIINGAERVIISQIVRSAGVYFSKEIDKKISSTRYIGQLIPTRGAWINYGEGNKNLLYAQIDKSKKIPFTTVLRMFGISSNAKIKELFGDDERLQATIEKDEADSVEKAIKIVHTRLRTGEEEIPLDGIKKLICDRLFDGKRYDLQKVGRYKYNLQLDVLSRVQNRTIAKDIVTPIDILDEKGNIIFEKNSIVYSKNTILDAEKIEFLKNNREIIRTKLDLDSTLTSEIDDALFEIVDIYSDSGDIVKIIGNNQNEERLHITISDIIASFSYFINLYKGIGKLDDIDHLGNRRLRLIGELLKNQVRVGLVKFEKNTIDRMSNADYDTVEPENLVNIKTLTSAIKEFFCSSQLSQFMDQINPLAEITQKRRISALGSGGITRDRAGVEVRDVHNSHYGRMCPIETPEGPSIGLITSLATYARVNDYGFIETPYFKAKIDEKGKKYISSKEEDIVYLSAEKEEFLKIASASTKLDKKGYFIDEKIIGRVGGETQMINSKDVDYMDVSPKQIVSVAASCVPFLEHNDATRALMGANMQRQAVPIIDPESPIVGTGMEYRAAKDSGAPIIAEKDGEVTYVDSKTIEIKSQTGKTKYDLLQYLRSNSATGFLHRPIVRVGDHVEANQIIADGQSMKDGELALGRNVRVAFMTWDGYNYEDAVIMSERMVYDDIYTSIHVEEYKIERRETKLGKEEFTKSVPNISSEQKKYLDDDGIIMVGTIVNEGDILVGKITPKGISEPTPEERLLLAIFGEKSRETKDSSLRVPHGGGGIVQSISHYKKSNGDDLPPGVLEEIKVYIVQKRKIKVGDKMAGRHGNKGVISNILPIEDMPYTKDGQPIDIMLNPQGVPSRMNIGQVLEMHLGIAAKKLGIKVATPVFDGASIKDIEDILKEADLPIDGKEVLYDGRTGEPFENKVNVGIMYFVKLSHMVDDKLHARDVGPYTLVTQQPMGGKAQNGGQRFGEMEVWALEAYGAAHTLQEMITVKSDDIISRNSSFKAITKGTQLPEPNIPESFRVLAKELQALCLDIELINDKGENEIEKSIVSVSEEV